MEIIENQFLSEQFKDPKLEKLISLLVLDKYFKNQIKYIKKESYK